MSEYTHASGDLIANPNTYFYTDYRAIDFIEAWRAHRARFSLRPTPPPAPKDAPLPRANEIVETDRLLEALAARSAQGPLSSDAARWLDLLVSKFETTKRIHRRYRPVFLAEDKADCRDLGRYLRLGEVFAAAWRQSPSLVLVNVLLKLIDTLCAHADALDEDQRGRLAHLIVCEAEMVAAADRGARR